MLLFYHNVLHLSSAFSNKFQIFHHFFLLYLFFFQFSGANPLFSPLKWMQKLGLSHNYFSVLYIKTKLIMPFFVARSQPIFCKIRILAKNSISVAVLYVRQEILFSVSQILHSIPQQFFRHIVF